MRLWVGVCVCGGGEGGGADVFCRRKKASSKHGQESVLYAGHSNV